MVRVSCDNCGKNFSKSRRNVELYNHNFCSRNCYREYCNEHREMYERRGTKKDYSALQKLLKFREKIVEAEMEAEK